MRIALVLSDTEGQRLEDVARAQHRSPKLQALHLILIGLGFTPEQTVEDREPVAVA